jgi:predicted methyltransferase
VTLSSNRLRGSSRRRVTAAAAPESSADNVAEDAAVTAATEGEEDVWGPWDPPLPPFNHQHHLLTWDVARALLDAKEEGKQRCDATLDFGISTVSLALLDGGFTLAADAAAAAAAPADETDGLLATWADVAEVAADEKGTYILHPGAPVDRFQVFSEGTSRAVSLMPSSPGMAPTALIAGFSMHRFGVGVDPMEDTLRKLGAVHPIRPGARVLDICTGLAYTAIGAYKRGGRVTTIELDPAMTQMCQMNPHSKELFSGEIQQLYGNAADVVPTLPDASFDRIIHDPPTFALAGELFSGEFYGHLRRILAPKGRLYHYIGDPASKSAGNVAKGVVQRLKEAGFGGVAIDYDAHGIIAAHTPVKLNSKKGPQKSFGKAASKGTSTDRRRGARGDEGKKGGRGGGGGGKGGGRGDEARVKRGRGSGRGGGGRRGSDDEYDDDDDFF